MHRPATLLLTPLLLGCLSLSCSKKSATDQNQPVAGTQAPAAANPSNPAAASPTTATAQNTSPAAPAASTPTAVPAAAAAPLEPLPQPVSVTIPAGERITVRTIDSIDSRHDTAGQVFRASLSAPIVVHGEVVVHVGAPVSVLLSYAKGAGRIQGRSELELRLSRLEYHGRAYPIDSGVVEEQGKGRGKQTAVRTGVGAAAGAIIGAIAGGGKGAAIGSAAGGGVGFGSDLFTHGQQVRIPSETMLSFRLLAPIILQP